MSPQLLIFGVILSTSHHLLIRTANKFNKGFLQMIMNVTEFDFLESAISCKKFEDQHPIKI